MVNAKVLDENWSLNENWFRFENCWQTKRNETRQYDVALEHVIDASITESYPQVRIQDVEFQQMVAERRAKNVSLTAQRH